MTIFDSMGSFLEGTYDTYKAKYDNKYKGELKLLKDGMTHNITYGSKVNNHQYLILVSIPKYTDDQFKAAYAQVKPSLAKQGYTLTAVSYQNLTATEQHTYQDCRAYTVQRTTEVADTDKKSIQQLLNTNGMLKETAEMNTLLGNLIYNDRLNADVRRWQ